MEKINVTKEIIDAFLSGKDPMMKIIKMEIGYDEDKIHIFYRNERGIKKVTNEPFYPFLWARQFAARNLFDGDRKKIKEKLKEYNIDCKGLRIEDNEGNVHPRMENGYRVLFQAKTPMSFSRFMQFFREGGRPVYPKEYNKNYGLRDYIVVAPNEQHMIMTGKRLFKGYEDYNDLIRVLWDLETEGLDPTKDMMTKIGIRTNKGFEKIIKIDAKDKETRDKQELEGIGDFCQILDEIDPDVISGHNSENFDWNFTDVRLQKHNSNLVEFTAPYFNGRGIYKKKKQQVLKLGGEQEYFYPTIKYGTNITDSLHAVRRAQAIDSNMEKADLKYITKYSKLNKPNRVYVPGNLIYKTDIDTEKNYAHNDKNGRWFKIKWEDVEKQDEFDPFADTTNDTPKRYRLIENGTKLVDTKNDEILDIVTGTYIVDRYLLDDLYETDKVELRYNQPNFLVGKMLPVAFDKMCTMGTAAIWKYIMLAWSYEHNLAIPELIETRKFTGGLSRLLSVGYVDRIVKLDYNSLYPSIILSYLIESPIDISGAMNAFLNYILTQREHYKELKAKFEEKGENATKELKKLIEENADADVIAQKQEEIQLYDAEVNKYDKLQLPLKITGNGFFGSYGSGSVFPHSDLICAEMTTCIGRMCLRLMIYHFTNIGYKPIVGDTDGFNFQMPTEDKFRYTKEHPYISNGKGRNSIEGKEYTGVDADVAEFEDLFLCPPYVTGINKMGLGVDEYAEATINFARKNYADLLIKKGKEKVKLVGNTIKSKKMPKYIKKFLDEAIKMLLHGEGKKFIEYYYDYVEKIYNLQIPLQDIALIGKIKTSVEEYKEKCQQVTAAGTKRARQAWYEFAIKENLNVNMGDIIYYINTGTKKSASDVSRITKYFYFDKEGNKITELIDKDGNVIRDKKGNTTDLTKYIEKEYRKYKKEALPEDYVDYTAKRPKLKLSILDFGRRLFPDLQEEDIVLFNCVRLSNDIVEDENEHFCNDEFEYNKDKYIDMFNKRIRPLLVCFDRSIRIAIDEKGKEIDNILIMNPKDRKYFTEEECKLVAGQPYNTTDQDTYEQLMTIEDKEIKFWLSINKVPPYVEECGMNWETIVQDYNDRMRQYEEEGIRAEVEDYNKIIEGLKTKDVKKVLEEGELPEKLLKFVDFDLNTYEFTSKKFNIKIGSLQDILDIELNEDDDDDE